MLNIALTIYNCSFCPTFFSLVHSLSTGNIEEGEYTYPWSECCNRYLACLGFPTLPQSFQNEGQKLLSPLSALMQQQ